MNPSSQGEKPFTVVLVEHGFAEPLRDGFDEVRIDVEDFEIDPAQHAEVLHK